MTAFRFLHSGDLHLGRRFGNLPEDVRGRLVEARHQILPGLAAAARGHGARHILLAGDTFDTETPTKPVWRQALAAMGAASDLVWWLLPGNHDSLAAETLWAHIAAVLPGNVRLVQTATAVEIEPGVALLPAPLPRRYSGRDLTDWMAACVTDPGTIRLGLAHGAVRDFSEEGQAADGIIPPDRAETARLDYLALGDWHGQMIIGPRAAYAGTPERDAFRHNGRGACLAVTVPAAGAMPVIDKIEVGQFVWSDSNLELTPGAPLQAAFQRVMPTDVLQRRNHLLRLRVTGRATLAEQAALQAAAAEIAPDFAHFVLDTSKLASEFDSADMDAIDRAGALRMAADRLASEACDETRSPIDRSISSAALNRLYGYLLEDSK